jgi:hypothetical protein
MDAYEKAKDIIEIAEEISNSLHISVCAGVEVVGITLREMSLKGDNRLTENQEMALKHASLMTCLHTTMAGAVGDEPLWG